MKKIIIILICLLTICFYFQRKQIVKISTLKSENENLKKTIDTLQSEVFTQKIQVQRYEYVLDRANEELNVECNEKLKEILSQTE